MALTDERLEDFAPRRALCVSEVLALIDEGAIPADQRLELIGGQLLAPRGVPPMENQALQGLEAALTYHFMRPDVHAEGILLSRGCPIELGADCLLESGLAVSLHSENDLILAPDQTYLVADCIEEDEAAFFQERLRHYAEGGVGEVWILDPANRAILVARGPQGSWYADLFTFVSGDTLAPGFAPEIDMLVDDIFDASSGPHRHIALRI